MIRRLEQAYVKKMRVGVKRGEEKALEDLVSAFQYIKGPYKKDGERDFSRTFSNRKRINGFKLKDDQLKLGTRKKFFMMRVVRHRNKLPREAIDVSSLVVFQISGQLDQLKDVSAHGRRGITI